MSRVENDPFYTLIRTNYVGFVMIPQSVVLVIIIHGSLGFMRNMGGTVCTRLLPRVTQ